MIGDHWRDVVGVTPSRVTQVYVDRIEYLSSKHPELLVPHAYTRYTTFPHCFKVYIYINLSISLCVFRYLGDLSGGQILKRSAKKILIKSMSPGDYNGVDGVKFYQFDQIKSLNEFKKMYRTQLDSLGNVKGMSVQLADAMVAEANYVSGGVFLC